MTTVWTLGHSTNDWHSFERLLAAADIGAVADVRSWPLSRLPHFSRPPLKARLNASGVDYVYLGLELGGRPRNGSAADYEAMAEQPLFLEGLSKVQAIASRSRLALMCSEHEPLTCHHCLLVGRRLVERGVEVAHILRDGRIEPKPNNACSSSPGIPKPTCSRRATIAWRGPIASRTRPSGDPE